MSFGLIAKEKCVKMTQVRRDTKTKSMHSNFRQEKNKNFRKNKFGEWPANRASRSFGRVFFDVF
jgi:hypothetical protein